MTLEVGRRFVNGRWTTDIENEAGAGAILKSTPVTLTDAQIKALPGTDIELVAAPGVGNMIVPVAAYLITDFAVAYSGIDTNTEYPAIWVSHSASPIYLFEFIDLPADEGGSSLTPFLTTTSEFGRAGNTLLPLQASAVRGNVGAGDTVVAIGNALPTAVFYPDDQANVSLKIGADNSINFTGGDAANTLKVTVLYTILTV